MIEFLKNGSWQTRSLALLGSLVIVLQWWGSLFFSPEWCDQWLWALAPAKGFPLWFSIPISFFLILCPIRKVLSPIFGFLGKDPSRIFNILLMTGFALGSFWFLRVGVLVLGDSKLIMDYFVALTTYASVREPLESVLHTEFSRLLLTLWGIHPHTSFQMLSCLWGVLMVVIAGYGLSRFPSGSGSYLGYLWLLFLSGPIHLFFGYIEWYTQMALGLILFEIYGITQILTGRGLWWALSALIFACCSHLVATGFVPAAIVLIVITLQGRRRQENLTGFILVLGSLLLITLYWIRKHIVFGHSLKATTNLFSTVLPLMRADNPNNPPGSWQYPWLSLNHLTDLFNEVLLCGLFPILILLGCCRWKEVFQGLRSFPRLLKEKQGFPSSQGVCFQQHLWFLLPQLFVSGIFLFVWNPWLGFPGDWDLFSFFTWPLLASALMALIYWTSGESRLRLLWIAGIPSFSVVMAWIVFYANGSLPAYPELKANLQGKQTEFHSQRVQAAIKDTNWQLAYQETEQLMAIHPPATVSQGLELLNGVVLQKMAEEWPLEKQLTRMACDFEIISASPARRLFMMDSWGRIYMWEAGWLNEWEPQGIPGIPELHAVAMEIVPWRKAAVILREDGALFEVPTSSWVEPFPERPGSTHFCEAPLDRNPRPMGNLFTDYAHQPIRPGQKAVDLLVDPIQERLIVLDTFGTLTSDKSVGAIDEPPLPYLAHYINIDVELNQLGSSPYIGTYFGGFSVYPGQEPTVPVFFDFNWPAIVDYEPIRGGKELCVLDVQGGVHVFCSDQQPFIDPTQMNHYSPHGKKEEYTPYLSEPCPFFSDLELVPGRKAYYRMNWNFRIYYAEAE